MRTIFTVIILLMIAIAPTTSQAYESTKQERNYIREGNKAFKDGNFAKALDFYDKALIAAPGSEYARFDRAVALSKLSANPEDSIFQESIKTYSDLAEFAGDTKIKEKANYNLGNLAFEQENYPQSIEYYKETLRINPNNLKARENLLVAMLKMPPEDNQDQQDQQQDQQQQQQDQQQQQQDQQQQPQPQPQELSNNAEQILQTMQNRENQTRENTKEEEVSTNRRTTDKPW